MMTTKEIRIGNLYVLVTRKDVGYVVDAYSVDDENGYDFIDSMTIWDDDLTEVSK